AEDRPRRVPGPRAPPEQTRRDLAGERPGREQRELAGVHERAARERHEERNHRAGEDERAEHELARPYAWRRLLEVEVSRSAECFQIAASFGPGRSPEMF